jgi:hypothetical protein
MSINKRDGIMIPKIHLYETKLDYCRYIPTAAKLIAIQI